MAIRYYNQAIVCDPQFVEAYNNMGNALKDAGRVEEAINCYRVCFPAITFTCFLHVALIVI
jgi:protein O-GlcNAc transferase